MDRNFTADPGDVTTAAFNFNEDTSMPTFQIILIVIMIIIMFGMGCAVEVEHLRNNLKKPVGISVGLACQIFLLPILSYGIISLSSMSAIQGLAFMLVGCSPGGSNSNILTYLVNGDISLSVAMTTFSNLLAMGTFPFYVFLYSYIQNIEDDLKIPFAMLGGTLLCIVIPIIIGIAVRYKYPSKVRYIPRVCAIFGLIMLITTIITMVFVTKMPFTFSPSIFAPTALLPLAAILVSCAITFIPQLKLSSEARKAIVIEVAIQNGGIPNIVLILSFGDRIRLMGQVLAVPLLYNIFQTAYTLLAVAGYQVWTRRQKGISRDKKDNRADSIEYKEEEEIKELVGVDA